MGDPYELYPVLKIGTSWQQRHKHSLFGVETAKARTHTFFAFYDKIGLTRDFTPNRQFSSQKNLSNRACRAPVPGQSTFEVSHLVTVGLIVRIT